MQTKLVRIDELRKGHLEPSDIEAVLQRCVSRDGHSGALGGFIGQGAYRDCKISAQEPTCKTSSALNNSTRRVTARGASGTVRRRHLQACPGESQTPESRRAHDFGKRRLGIANHCLE